MAVYVQGSGPVPTYVQDMSLQLWPDKPVLLDWPRAMKLVDRRLVRVVGYENLDDFIFKDGDTPYIYWLSPFSQGDGYATAAESMVYWITRHGLKASVHYSWFLVEEGLRPETLAMLRAPDGEPHRVGVCMATPGEFEKLPTPYKIGFTMYESSDPLRVYPEWRHQCNAVDRLFVPCNYCKELFSEFAKVPIDVVPLAIHEGYCNPKLRTPQSKFRVVTYATLTGRKAPLEMIDTFQRAFQGHDDVEFVLKTRLGLVGSQDPGVPDFNDPRIKIMDGTWSWQDLRRLLYSSDCMFYLSKGEGFGMTPREAMATGCPTILADNSGMSDVCDDRYNWPVPTLYTEPSPLGGDWNVPDWDYAVDVLRHIYHNRNAAYRQAYNGAHWFINNHGPSRAAEHFIDTISDVQPHQYKVAEGSLMAPPSLLAEAMDVARSLIPSLNGTRAVALSAYKELAGCDVHKAVVVLKDKMMASTYEQLFYAVSFLLTSRAKALVIVAPSVHLPPTNDNTKYWRLKELQHVLRGQTVPVLKYIANHKWLLAVVTQPGRDRIGAFGHVIDGRWKPT